MKLKNKILNKIALGAAILLSSFVTFNNSNHVYFNNTNIVVNASEIKETDNGTLYFKNKKQLKLGDIDELGRATAAHIQLQDKDEPKQKREKKIKYNPSGWHNYKFYYENGENKAWLMNRGHLIGSFITSGI